MHHVYTIIKSSLGTLAIIKCMAMAKLCFCSLISGRPRNAWNQESSVAHAQQGVYGMFVVKVFIINSVSPIL